MNEHTLLTAELRHGFSTLAERLIRVERKLDLLLSLKVETMTREAAEKYLRSEEFADLLIGKFEIDADAPDRG